MQTLRYYHVTWKVPGQGLNGIPKSQFILAVSEKVCFNLIYNTFADAYSVKATEVDVE